MTRRLSRALRGQVFFGWLLASAWLVPTAAPAQTLTDLANAELHLPTVCPSFPTVGVYGSLGQFLIPDVLDSAAQQGSDVTVVERAALDAILAEFALAPYLDPATAPATGQLLGAKFLVLVEANLPGMPLDIDVGMVRTDTQEVVYDDSTTITDADGADALDAALAQIANAIASIVASNNYACPRLGSLTYVADVTGTDWAWNVAGYLDVVIRETDGAGTLEAIVRHVPTANEVEGLLVSASPATFPTVTVSATAQTGADPQQPPTSYLLQFFQPAAPAQSHVLLFDEPPNPVLNTGRQNEVDFPNMAAVALAQWMRVNGNPSLVLEAQVTGDTPVTWTVPTGDGMLTLTWVLP